MNTSLRNHAINRLVTAIRVGVLLTLFLAVSTAVVGSNAAAAAPACAAGTSASDMSTFFDTASTGLVGGDYPHSYPLGDGRVLWLFQDAFIGDPATATLTSAGFAHNVALLQTGLCFELRWGGGPITSPSSFLGGALETDLSHWWWPLGGELDADGNLDVFAAEFHNLAGTGAAAGAEPVAVWRAVIRVTDLAVLSFAPAPDSLDRPLFGFSVTSDDAWSYLYGNCYRQFTSPGYVGLFDTGCTTKVNVARVPRGQFELPPSYWDGSSWVADRNSAAVVHGDGCARRSAPGAADRDQHLHGHQPPRRLVRLQHRRLRRRHHRPDPSPSTRRSPPPRSAVRTAPRTRPASRRGGPRPAPWRLPSPTSRGTSRSRTRRRTCTARPSSKFPPRSDRTPVMTS